MKQWAQQVKQVDVVIEKVAVGLNLSRYITAQNFWEIATNSLFRSNNPIGLKKIFVPAENIPLSVEHTDIADNKIQYLTDYTKRGIALLHLDDNTNIEIEKADFLSHDMNDLKIQEETREQRLNGMRNTLLVRFMGTTVNLSRMNYIVKKYGIKVIKQQTLGSGRENIFLQKAEIHISRLSEAARIQLYKDLAEKEEIYAMTESDYSLTEENKTKFTLLSDVRYTKKGVKAIKATFGQMGPTAVMEVGRGIYRVVVYKQINKDKLIHTLKSINKLPQRGKGNEGIFQEVVIENEKIQLIQKVTQRGWNLPQGGTTPKTTHYSKTNIAIGGFSHILNAEDTRGFLKTMGVVANKSKLTWLREQYSEKYTLQIQVDNNQAEDIRKQIFDSFGTEKEIHAVETANWEAMTEIETFEEDEETTKFIDPLQIEWEITDSKEILSPEQISYVNKVAKELQNSMVDKQQEREVWKTVGKRHKGTSKGNSLNTKGGSKDESKDIRSKSSSSSRDSNSGSITRGGLLDKNDYSNLPEQIDDEALQNMDIEGEEKQEDDEVLVLTSKSNTKKDDKEDHKKMEQLNSEMKKLQVSLSKKAAEYGLQDVADTYLDNLRGNYKDDKKGVSNFVKDLKDMDKWTQDYMKKMFTKETQTSKARRSNRLNKNNNKRAQKDREETENSNVDDEVTEVENGGKHRRTKSKITDFALPQDSQASKTTINFTPGVKLKEGQGQPKDPPVEQHNV